jgi:hypothetical protein
MDEAKWDRTERNGTKLGTVDVEFSVDHSNCRRRPPLSTAVITRRYDLSTENAEDLFRNTRLKN